MKQSTPQSNTTPRYSSLQISTTPRGRAVPIVYGTSKVTSDIVWAADFHNVAYTSNSGGGSGKGMGGSSGKGNQGTTEYFYFAAFVGSLCEGPIYAFVAARSGSNWIYFNGNSPAFAWPVTSQWPTASGGVIPYEGYPLAAYLGVTSVAAQNLMPWEVVTQQNYSPYEESGMVGDNNAVNPSSNKGFRQNGQDWENIGPNSWASQSFMLMQGYNFQPYPPYIGAHYPSQVDSYQYTAYWFSPAYQLGQSATPPTIDWWVVGLLPYDPTGAIVGIPIIDAEPSAVVTDVITNPIRGAAVPPNFIDPVTFDNYHRYCVASGLFLSAVLSSQTEVTQVVNLIMQQTVSDCFWSEGMLKIVPWYDQPITGHNATFVPNLTPVYTITDAHLIDQKSTGPMEVQRSSVYDTYNQLSINFNNRGLNYSTDTITVDDQAQQQLFGVRPAPPAMAQYIADASVAAASAQLQLYKIVYNRNTYTFTLPSIFCLLEPMDIILINDPGLGVVGLPVRIQTISLNDKDEYQVMAENIVDELYGVQARNQQISAGSGLPGSVPPGSVNDPFIFVGPTNITGQDLEIWIATTGSQQGWGGCNVWMSTDGTHYEKVGTHWGGARYGFLQLPLSPYGGAEPDTTDLLFFATFGPNNQLASVTAAQAQQGLTLVLIQTGSNFELLSYQNVNLLSQAGNFTTYVAGTLYRGLSGTFPISHNARDQWARLDGNIFKIPIHISMLGQTVFFKLTSFNVLGSMVEPISEVVSYPFVIQGGTSSPVGVTSLVIGTDGKFTIITWEADNSQEVIGYVVRYGAVGGTFGQAKLIIQAISSSHSVTLIMPPGTWVFYVASYDKIGVFSSTIQSQIFTVPNFQQLFLEQNYGPVIHSLDAGYVLHPEWQGTNATFTNCFVHPTAWNLVPIDGALASFDDWSWVDEFCITPAASFNYLSPAIDIGDGQTNVRGSVQLYEYLWGVSSPIPATSQIVVTLNPDWNAAGTVLTGCLVHPTAWVIVPTDTLAANYAGADHGWEVFDFTVFSPPVASTIAYTMNVGATLPVQALLQTSVKASPGGATPILTGSISNSGDGTHFLPLVSGAGAGQISSTAVDQYFQFTVTMNNAAGQQTIYHLPPDWSGVVLNRALVHPTSYVICPSDTVLASFDGFAIFDNFVVTPSSTSTVTYTVDSGAVQTVTASITTNVQAAPLNTLGTGLYVSAIGYSNSPTGPFTQLVNDNGSGNAFGTVSARYFQFTVTIQNVTGSLATIQNMTPSVTILSPSRGGIGTLQSMLTEVIIAPSKYWTSVIPQIRTSADGSTWGSWQPIPSTFTNQEFMQFQINWSLSGAIWPFGIDSVWLLCDGTPITQTGSVTTAAGTATIVFTVPFRQVPTVTATVQGSASVVALIASVNALGFVLDTFTTSTGAAANAAVSWSATGI